MMRVSTKIYFDISNEEIDRLFMTRLQQLAENAFFKDGVLQVNTTSEAGVTTSRPVENPTAVQLAAVRFRDELTQAKSQLLKAEEYRKAAAKFQEKRDLRALKRKGG